MRGNGLFEVDVLLDDQWGAMSRRKSPLSSEKRLMLAVLKSALESYQEFAFADDAKEQEMFDEAAAWIASSNDEWLFSYRSICENIGVDPEYLRRRLRQWRDRGPLPRQAVGA